MSSNSDSLKIEIPSGLVSGTDPLRVAISASLTKLQESLKPDENGQINYVPVAWHFRDAVDMFTMLAVSIAVAPLAPSDAPLPGWRRRLWHSRFSEAASELLNWAVSYLPRRCRAGNLASNAMQLLFGPGVEVVTGPALPCTTLLGMGTAAETTGSEWKRWRDAFFSCSDLQVLPQLAKDVVQFFPHLQELMIAFDNFLSLWNVKVVRRGNYARLMLQGAGSHELPPFFAVMECPHCHRMESLFGLVSARAGDNFLYAEVGTGHLIDAPIDITFKRRFFAQPSRRISNSRENLFLVTAEPLAAGNSAPEPALEDSIIEEAKRELLNVVGEQVYTQYHLPVLAVVSEAEGQFPLELLNDPSLGCSDGEVLLGHLKKFLQCDSGVISCLRGITVEKLQAMAVSRRVDTCAQLAYWSEDRVVNGGGHDKMDRLAITHLAGWVVKSREKRLAQRLLNNTKAVDRIVDWLQRQAQDGSHLDRVLRVSDDWLQLWAERPEYNSYIVNMKVMRAECWQRQNDIEKAKEELDGAISITEQDAVGLRLLRAKALCGRARLNMDLKEYALAGEDAVLAVDDLSSVIASANAETLSVFLDAVWLLAQAMLSLGTNVQAIAALHRAVWAKLNPTEMRERVKLARINYLLAKLQASEKNCNVWSVRSAYDNVLKLLNDNELQDREIVEMWTLSKAGVLRFSEETPSLEALQEAKELLARQTEEAKTAEIVEALLWVNKKIVENKENAVKQSQPSESEASEQSDEQSVDQLSQAAVADVLRELGDAIAAGTMLAELNPSEANWIDLASLWEKQAHLQSGLDSDGELQALGKAWSIYRDLLDKGYLDVQEHFSQLWIDRSLLLMQRNGAEALRELQAVAEYWETLPEDKRVHPRYIELFNALSSLCDAQEQPDKSLEYLNRAIEVTRNCKHLSESGSKTSLDNKDAGDTGVWQTRLANLLRARAHRLYNSGTWLEAGSDFGELINLLEDEAEIKRLRLARALANLRAGRCEESHHDFELLSNDGDLLGTAGAGWAMFGLKDAGQAVHYFRQLTEPEQPAEPDNKVAAVWARWGLAEVYSFSDNAVQAQRERLQAMREWLGTNFVADGDIDSEALLTNVGLLDWEFADLLLQGTNELITAEKYAEAKRTLQEAQTLTRTPYIPEEFSKRQTKAHLLNVKLLALSGQKDQALQAGFAWLNQDSLQDPGDDLSAWVSLFCARALIENRQFSTEVLHKLEFIVNVLQRSAESGEEEAQVYWALLSAMLARVTSEVDPEKDVRPSLEKAEKLLNTLRKSHDEKVYCWEIVYIFCVQLLIALRHNRTSKSALMLSRMADALNNPSDPLPMLQWCRPVTLNLIVETLSYCYPPSVEIASAWARLLACPVWDESYLTSIEAVCSRFIPQTNGRYWKEMAAIAEAIMMHPEAEARTESSQLLSSWWQRVQDLCAAGDEDGMVSLLAFCELILARIESPCWPPNCPWQAYSLLIERLGKEENKAETLAWMGRASAFIERSCSAEERAQRLTQIELERAITLFEVDRISEAVMAVEDAEAIVEETYYDNPPAELIDQIVEVRKLLNPEMELDFIDSPTATPAADTPVPAPEELPAASAPVISAAPAAEPVGDASAPAQEELPAASAPVISAAPAAEPVGASASSQEELPAASAPVISAAPAAEPVADASAPTQEELPAVSAPVISAESAAEPVGASASSQEELPAASAPVISADPAAESAAAASEEAEMGEIAAVLNIFDQGAALPPENIVAPFGASTGIMTAPAMASLASMSAAETSLEPLPAVQDTQPRADNASASGIPSADNPQSSEQPLAQPPAIEGDAGLLGAPIENDAAGEALLGAPASLAGGGEGDVLLGAPDLEAAELDSSNQLGTPADAETEKTFAGAEPAQDVPHSEEKAAEPSVADIPPEPTGLASPKVIAGLLETMPEEQRQPAQAWLDEMNAHIDNGFAWLDREGVGQAEKTFWYVGGRLAEYPQLAGCLMAGLLEGSVETARSFAAGGFKQEAIRLISRVCLLAREYLNNQYDRDAWAWWGDAERLAGAMMHGVGKPNEAVDYLYQARNIFSEMLKNNKNPEARIDVFRISASRAALLLEMGFVPDAMEEYRIAIDNGLQVLADGFHEEMAVASLHVARGRLAIETGQLEMASHDYAWALETYEQLFVDDVDCVMEMCTARAGLAEAYAYLGNMAKMKEHFKGLLACRAQLDSEGKYDQVVVLDDLLENLNELGRTLFG